MVEAPKDPLAVWRELVGQWEKSVNTLANQTMGSEEFSRSMNQATRMSLELQRSMAELMARYLTLLNLPTRQEFAGLAERLKGIEDGVNRVAAALERGAAGAHSPAPDTKSKPARTRQPSARGAAS